MSKSNDVKKELVAIASKEKAVLFKRYFKTGKGEYGEGDVFLGITVPEIRRISKIHSNLSLDEVVGLLRSREHEARLAALLIMVWQFERGEKSKRQEIFDVYINNTRWVNNWDLVDLSAPKIVGRHLLSHELSLLKRLATSGSIWERRIAIISTLAFIKQNDPEPTFMTAKILLRDNHDLIHKAVGWMLREVGKNCGIKTECVFLDSYYREMPRTMLRYAIERLPERLRKYYLMK